MDAVTDRPQTESARSASSRSSTPATTNPFVRKWIDRMVEMCQPDEIVWLDGSLEERQRLLAQGVRDGIFIKLNQDKLPGCYLHRSNPNDVARSEHLTFICTPGQDMAGATEDWSRAADGMGRRAWNDGSSPSGDRDLPHRQRMTATRLDSLRPAA